ncbi:pentatricopeptide repeat-containing protein At2g37310 [Sesamum indicum]|uniref:Pentatricopeptide repeat-containing protein At2g37310 n=1 Tax=Sesamum indicum TaxID=4182 RepID=A0A6I9T1M4_SESIN|nr:pentatricopeptide repeat-containing protein At2g37310 [Sesamum indicum]
MKLAQPLPRQALQSLLQSDGHRINYTLYGHLIQRCTDRRLSRQAKQLHARLILSSTTADNFLASKLIAFYSKIHQLTYARRVFDQIPYKNTFAYNALLIAYSVHGRHTETLELFRTSLSRRDGDLVDVNPDSFTLSCVLKAMSEVVLDGPLSAGMIHCYVIKNGLDLDVFVGNGLVTYYSRCDDLVSARYLFDEMPDRDLVSWNSMLSGYSQGGFYEECKELYRMMLGLEDVRPDGVTAVSVLHACAQSTDLVFGMEVHQYVMDNGIKMDLSVCNSIIALYAKCGSLDYARELFEEMTEKDEITYSTIVSGYMVHGFIDDAMKIFGEMKNPGMSTWNAVISGRVQNNQYDKVLDLVRQMQAFGFKPNSVTLSSILPAIPYVSHLKGGKEIHAYAIKISCDRNIYVVTAMIDTYAKLGFLVGAQRVFNLTKDRSVIVWTAIISAYAAHGDANMALSLFDEMLNSKTKPDAVTFTAVFAACAHAGLVEEAWEVFNSVLPKYGIQPLPNHYACIVACLSRAGKLSEAVEFVKKMPTEPTAQVWGALLTGASESDDVELAKFVCDHLFELEPENPSNYIVMANLYSKAGRWEEAERVREKMNAIGFKKVAGSSRIETSGGLLSFIAGGATDEKTNKIL